MTLEQVIDRYSNNAEYERIHGSLQGCLDFRQLAEWLKDYKRLLEQQPCEDVVSRKKVEEITWDEPSYTDALNVLTEVRDKVRALPSVTRQTGKWIDDGWYADGHSHKVFHCSECGHNVLGFKEDLSKFCPNCGAKMNTPYQKGDKE